jgi:hypothetical protein
MEGRRVPSRAGLQGTSGTPARKERFQPSIDIDSRISKERMTGDVRLKIEKEKVGGLSWAKLR